MQSFSFNLICKKYFRKNSIFTTGLEHKNAEITLGKVYDHDKPLLLHMKPETAAKILTQLHSSTPVNQY